MIKVKITEDQLKRVKELYKFGELNNSITKGKGNIIGAIGEVVAYDHFIGRGHEVDFTSTYEYDMIVDGFKVDVKSKATNYEPKGYFNCSISAFNTTQQCDYYLFTYVTYDHKYCYLAGYKEKDSFFALSHFGKKGEIDYGKWEYKADCYNMKIKEPDKLRTDV